MPFVTISTQAQGVCAQDYTTFGEIYSEVIYIRLYFCGSYSYLYLQVLRLEAQTLLDQSAQPHMIRRSLWVYISIKPILPTHIFCPYFSFCIFNCSSGPLWELLAMRIICLHNPRDILNLISFFTLFTPPPVCSSTLESMICDYYLLLLLTSLFQILSNVFFHSLPSTSLSSPCLHLCC